MRVLVTGGAGFIGSNFVHYLLEQTEHQVITLDALTYAGDRANLDDLPDSSRHEFVEGDICNTELVQDLLERADAVVNFAAESHVDRSIEGADAFVSTNVQGTQTLLEAATETSLERFVHLSTDEVYGEIAEGAFDEDDPLRPRNPYAASKASADLVARSYHVTHQVPTVIVRPSNNYGPRQHQEKLIPKLIQRATAGKSLPIYGDGTNVREWTYVRDNCRAIELLSRKGIPGEIYNIGSGIEHENIEVARQIVDTVDASPDLIEFVEDRPAHDQRYALHTEKIESLGWKPMWSFENGLRQTIDYYMSKNKE